MRKPLTIKTDSPAAGDENNDKALSDKSDPSDKSDKALSGALESWLGPMADQIAATADLSDTDLDKSLREGLPVKPGDSTEIEAAMTEDMEKQYGNQIQGR